MNFYNILKQTFKRLVFMLPAHALVFFLTWFGIGPSPIPILSFFNLPLIYILVRKSPTLINIPLLIVLTLGAAFAHDERSSSPMESYFENFSILTIVGGAISVVTLTPMIVTKFITIKIHQRFTTFTHNVNSRLLFPIIWTITWSLFRRFSPLGSWGDWAYTIDNSGYAGDPLMQIASVGGLSAINFFLALWMQVISDFLILKHRINKATRISNIDVDENTPLIEHQSSVIYDIDVFKEDLTNNYYLRLTMVFAILGCFFFGGQRLNYVESNIDHIPSITVGCVIPGNEVSTSDMILETLMMANNLQAEIVLWSESAVALGSQSDHDKLLDEISKTISTQNFYLGITYTIPTGHNNKKKNMLKFIKKTPAKSGPKEPKEPKESSKNLSSQNDEILFEYQKTHPVPLVESYSTESGPGNLFSKEIEVEKKKKKKGNIPKETVNMTVSGAICLDMDFPELLGQASKADLILAPAQTWSAHVGLQHLRMSSVRAIENGYWILRCDGGGASGLVDPYGRIRHVQISNIDHISLYTWEMPLKGEKLETYYASYGEGTVWGALISLGICELAWYFAWRVAEEDMDHLTEGVQGYFVEKQTWLESKYDEIFDREELPPSEQQSLI